MAVGPLRDQEAGVVTKLTGSPRHRSQWREVEGEEGQSVTGGEGAAKEETYYSDPFLTSSGLEYLRNVVS